MLFRVFLSYRFRTIILVCLHPGLIIERQAFQDGYRDDGQNADDVARI